MHTPWKLIRKMIRVMQEFRKQCRLPMLELSPLQLLVHSLMAAAGHRRCMMSRVQAQHCRLLGMSTRKSYRLRTYGRLCISEMCQLSEKPLGTHVYMWCISCPSSLDFVFDCPAYSHIRSQHLDLLQHCCTIADFMILCEPNACGGFLMECFACRKQILSVWIYWTDLHVCWVPVAPQDIKHIDWLIDWLQLLCNMNGCCALGAWEARLSCTVSVCCMNVNIW